MCTADLENHGWISLYRKMENWRWYKDSYVLHVFIDLLLHAKYKDGFVGDVEVKRGQVLTSLQTLQLRTGIAPQRLRTVLKKLCRSGEIIKKSTNRYTLITICNYNSYQDSELTANNQLTIKQQTNNTPLTYNQQATNTHLTTYNNSNKGDNGNNAISTDIIYVKNDVENDSKICLNNKPTSELELQFEAFRKSFPGVKRGWKTEFDNFKKKYPKEWTAIVPLLYPAMERMVAERERLQKAGAFAPEYPMLATWINQRRWEQEYNNLKPISYGNTKIAGVHDSGCGIEI